MYQYSDFDRQFLAERNTQFRAQVARRLDGSLTEEEFRPLRLMNGLYLQLHAYMLRVAIPYGTFNSTQMEALADIADRWDKGYGHFTTRQNIQFNWPKLVDVPDILDALAKVDMHAVQTSGNCVRAVTADHFAGAARDEIEDPRPTAELIRQWFIDHPEFAFLPRKFKFAVSGSRHDRAVVRAHDVGVEIVRDKTGAHGYRIFLGGGLGRTPMLGKVVRDFLPKEDLLPYIEAVLQVYNQSGRRDNKYKARIKILVHENSLAKVKSLIEARLVTQKALFKSASTLKLSTIAAHFDTPLPVIGGSGTYDEMRLTDPVFRSFCDTNVAPHRNPDYAIVNVSLKKHGRTPGDVSSTQMRALGRIAKTLANDEMRVSHEQNIVLPHVAKADVYAVFQALLDADLATANIGLISDIIACPGMDYCGLATARSIPVAKDIAQRFEALKLEQDIGDIKIKISGCINACGHHHVGHIGILGLEKSGVESYQITLGGDGTERASIGQRVGPGFSATEILPAIERLISTYLDLRYARDETFIETFRRTGITPFREALYGSEASSDAA